MRGLGCIKLPKFVGISFQDLKAGRYERVGVTPRSKITFSCLEKPLIDLQSQQPTVERLQELRLIRNGTDVELQKPVLSFTWD